MKVLSERTKQQIVRAGSVAIVGVLLMFTFLPSIDDLARGEATTRGFGPSMSRGPIRMPGVLDDGDFAVAGPVRAREDVITLVEARRLGIMVAGDYGDVVSFDSSISPEYVPGSTRHSALHRAIVWIEYNQSSGLFDVPSMALWNVSHLMIPELGYWDPRSGSYRRDASEFTGGVSLISQGQSGGLHYFRGQYSGFLTKGDFNLVFDVAIVKVEWIQGKVVKVIDREDFEATRAAVLSVYAGLVGILAFIVWRRT